MPSEFRPEVVTPRATPRGDPNLVGVLKSSLVALVLLAVACGRTGETLPSPPSPLPPVETTQNSWDRLVERQDVPFADREPLRHMAELICAQLSLGRSMTDIALDLVAAINEDGPLRSRSDVVVLVAIAVGTGCPERQDDLERLLTEGLPR